MGATNDVLDGEKVELAAEPAELAEFAFWIGEWDLTWGEDGREKGTNRIRAILDGKVILEEFDGAPAIDFRGKSFSAYDPTRGWVQTWVDSAGGYLDFCGGMQGARMILSRQFEQDGQTIYQRMVWYNIQADELDWNWERSADSRNWQVLWKIHYRRHK